jgi:hypothetical protein
MAALILLAGSASAQDRLILRPTSSVDLQDVVQRYSLTVVDQIDSAGQVYTVTAPAGQSVKEVEHETERDDQVAGVEADQSSTIPEVTQSTAAILDSLPPASSVTYFGVPVLTFYTAQPAVVITQLDGAQTQFNASGAGIVAVIDTGIDPTHTVLQSSIVPGYDFVHNLAGTGSEWVDLTAQNQAALANSNPQPSSKNTVALVSQSTAAILDQSTAAILDYQNLPRAFGHGTMVAGLVHLAAPTAQIMPLKAFSADGTANLSDILRAVYYAADHGARVINMSFTLTAPSTELANAIQYAAGKNVICVAAAGNDGKPHAGSPANLHYVLGIASTSNLDVRSIFSSYGTGVFMAAPGEGVVTTYPGQNYAEATGTSFSAPLVSGTVSLAIQVAPSIQAGDLDDAMGHAKRLKSTGIGHGRLDALQTLQSLSNNGRSDDGKNDSKAKGSDH